MNFLKELKKISSDTSYSKNYVDFFDNLLVLLKKEKRPKDSDDCFAFIDYINDNRIFYVPKGVSNTILSDFYLRSYVFPFEKGNIFFKKCDAKLNFVKNTHYYNIFREYLKTQKFCFYYSGDSYFGIEMKKYISKKFPTFESEVTLVVDELNYIAMNETTGFKDLLRLSYESLVFYRKEKYLLHDFSTVDFVKFFIDKYNNEKDLQFQKIIQMFFVGSYWHPEDQELQDNCLYFHSLDFLENHTTIPLTKKNVAK